MLRLKEMWCILVDYYMHDATTETDYTLPCYLCADNDKNKMVIYFMQNIVPNLRVFGSKDEADEYIKAHCSGYNLKFENARAVRFTPELAKWREKGR